jgi:hypothetical protein
MVKFKKDVETLHLPGSDGYGIKWTNFKQIGIAVAKFLLTISSFVQEERLLLTIRSF